jgi:hypothetical protein
MTNQGAQQNEPHGTDHRASWKDRNRRPRNPHNQQRKSLDLQYHMLMSMRGWS